MLSTPIDDEVASSLVAQLLFLQHSDPERDIWFYINSPGGSVRDGLAIYDTMQLIAPDVNTVCLGMARQHGHDFVGRRRKRQALFLAALDDLLPPSRRRDGGLRARRRAYGE